MAPGEHPAQNSGVAGANPAALTASQMAILLGISEEKVRSHIAEGAPVGASGAINLVHYTAWLILKEAKAGGQPA
jgi:hypothetical protein